LLIRNVDHEIKKKLSDSAHSNGRSLSEEAAIRLRRSLADEGMPRQPAGQRLRALVDGFKLTDEEQEAIATSRREADRSPPAFDAKR
jgi:plasmid stability protein